MNTQDRGAMMSELTESTPGMGGIAPQGADMNPLNVRSVFAVIDAMLKRPQCVTHEILHGRTVPLIGSLLLVAVVCMLAYGVIMGSFSGGKQFAYVPIKLCLGLLSSALICLPSLYIFTCLGGGRQSLLQTTGLLMKSLGLASVLMVGFGPVSWVFSQSTDTVEFMSFLHAFFWVVAVIFSVRQLVADLEAQSGKSMELLKLWVVVFLVVSFQMCTTLRPLVGAYEGPFLQPGKQFFLSHWME